MMIILKMYKLPIYGEIRSGLQGVKGIGFWKSFKISALLGLAFPYFLTSLNTYRGLCIKILVKIYSLNDDRVERKIAKIKKDLENLNNRRWARHRDSLPVNGQRTRSNAGTLKRFLRVLREKIAAAEVAAEMEKKKSAKS